MDPRDQYIAEVVRGKAFADVGGLWGTVAERISVARQHGAVRFAMIDVMPEGSEWWAKFRARMSEMGIRDCECMSCDVADCKAGPFDVVHSSGILYHCANPIEYLFKLYGLAREYVILTSAVIPPLVRNRYGRLDTRNGGPIFVPAMTAEQKKVYAEFYTQGDGSVLLGGINHEAIYMPHNYSAWWWLLPAKTIGAMCESTGFQVVRDAPNWGGKAHTFLLKNTGRKDMAPLG